MDKSLFAGLTILDPDESILEDNGAFTKRDRQTIDRLLEIGAKTHRHNAAAGLGNPVSEMSGSAVASAGQIPAEISFSLAYTLEDSQGGETLLSPQVTVSTPSVIDPPIFAPSGASDYSAGGLLTDTYYYAYSYIDDAGGETPVGPTVSVEREPGYANGRVLLSSLSVGLASAGAAGWNLYRAVGGGDLSFLASGTGDSYTDDGSQSVNCDIQPLDEDINTTNGDNSMVLVLPSADAFVAEAEFINVYMSEDGTFSGDVLIDQFPLSSAGQSVVYSSLEFLEGQPPDTNNSIGGASKIDPDTELLDWHWKRPVASAGALPAGEQGDARVTLNDGTIYVYTGSAWVAAAGGGGGASGTVRDVSDGVTTATDVESILFTASGNATLAVIDNGTEAEVVISASGGGGGGGGGSITASGGYDGSNLTGIDKLTVKNVSYNADDGTGLLAEVAAGGAGEAYISITAPMPQQMTASGTVSSVASGASGIGTFNLEAQAADLLKIGTNKRCRVRVYGDTASRAADASRPIGTDPDPGAGVILDYFLNEAGGGRHILSPVVAAYVMTEPPDGTLYLSVTNYDSTGDVVVSFYLFQTFAQVF